MNKIVAVSALAAAPVARPSIAATLPAIVPPIPQEDRRSPAACLRRAEEAIELMRTRYIREGWKIDEEAAERALAYSQKYAANGPASEDDDQDTLEFQDAIDFFHSHGISLDWIFDGDIAGLICRCAHHSQRANTIADAQLLALADRYAVAFQKWGDLAVIADEMQFDRKANPMPEVLRWRGDDIELGLPDIRKEKLEIREIAWDCEAFIGKIRDEKWVASISTETGDDMTLRIWRFQPSTKARARADEIIAAFDKWKKERKSRGFKKAEREADKAFKDFARIQDEVDATPAQALEGLMAKVRCAKLWAAKGKKLKSLDAGAETMALSIFDDLEKLTSKSA